MRRFLLSCFAASLNAFVLMLVRGSLDVTFLLLVTLWVVIEGTLADEVPRGSRNLAVLASLTGFAIVALFVVALQSRGGSTFGALVMLAGIALRCIAIYTLGDRFVSELRADAPLIRRGVYRFLDHPSEAGLLTLTLGACVLFGSIAAFAIWLFAVLPLTIARVRIENTFLRDKQECLSYTHITSSTMPTTTERTGPSFESST